MLLRSLEHMQFEVLNHGWTPVWKLMVEIAKLYWDLALALPIAASVSCNAPPGSITQWS